MRSWPSLTAEAVCMARALEQRRPDRLVDDPHAVWFLRGPARAAVRAFAVSGSLGSLAERGLDPGLITAIAARHGWIDARVVEALRPGAQLLLLGAGYDSRPWRLDLTDVTCVALDHPATARRKRRRLRQLGLDAAARHAVPADLELEPLPDALARTPLRHDHPTVVVWEGVSMYLDAETVGRTLRQLHQVLGPDVVVVLDVWSADRQPASLVLAEATGRVGLALLGEPLRFACLPVKLASFFADHGWTVQQHTDVDAHARLHAGRRAFPRLQLVVARPA